MTTKETVANFSEFILIEYFSTLLSEGTIVHFLYKVSNSNELMFYIMTQLNLLNCNQ